MALSMTMVAPDSNHETECLDVVKNTERRTAGTSADGGAQDASAKAPKCDKIVCSWEVRGGGLPRLEKDLNSRWDAFRASYAVVGTLECRYCVLEYDRQFFEVCNA